MTKTTAIVASAAYMDGKGLGPEIDRHDFVIRVTTNYIMCEKNQKDFGRKTTHVYLNKWTKNRLNVIPTPQGARVKLKRHLSKETYDVDYEANTGVLCVVEFASLGHKIKVYGMDFYAGGNDGLIPDFYSIRDSEDTKQVDRRKVYAKGYELLNDPTIDPRYFRYAHVGGLRDFRIFLKYQKMYGIETDPYMAAVIEKNRHRV
jgi:hypothetical protein